MHEGFTYNAHFGTIVHRRGRERGRREILFIEFFAGAP